MLKKITFCVLILIIMVGCQNTTQNDNENVPTGYPITEFTEKPQINPTFVETTPAPPVLETVEKTPTALLTSAVAESTDAPMETPSTPENGLLYIDHTAVDYFRLIPDDVILNASQLTVMFRHASIGENIRYGLECIYGDYPDRRPNSCSDFHDLKYDFSNWSFQFRGNPGWIEKVDDFVRETEKQSADFDVFMFTLTYGDGLDGTTFPEFSDPQNFQTLYIDKLEALEAKHPDKTFVWWTTSLARVSQQNSTKFNEMLRDYAEQNHKILVDLADLESYDPNGTQCLDEFQSPVICAEYTDEEVSGHLNELGRERAAMMFWGLMAQLTGWRP